MFEGEYYLPDFSSDSFESLKEDSTVIETCGTIPEISDDKEKIEWLCNIDTCMHDSKDELMAYMKDNAGHVSGFGIHYEGYMFVDIDKNSINKVDQKAIDEMYSIIEANAEKSGMKSAPVVFREETTFELHSRTDYWANMIGGIKINYDNESGTTYKSTLAFAAEDSSGTPGFVISGHSAVTAGGVGGEIRQGGRIVGYVDYLTLHFADAAWVEASNVLDDIYYADNNVLKDVTAYGDTNVGAKVYMSGITTETTSGYVIEDYTAINQSGTGITFYDQFTADYDSEGGDSGGPVFRKTVGGVKIVGMHWGGETRSVFSPVSGVILDLGVTPLY
ncbi:S1 family peptidase [Methanolobus bombayensis]|uniref:S1 family peptidase n=1 Tax=Methanolobus bombayensis TaxID=38023 RepID=UPI001FD7D475|nr:S1 family peptidase [Methanolobus bombayensis]MBP1909738.1 hypothetical protein [Methanolobus bombayensis]